MKTTNDNGAGASSERGRISSRIFTNIGITPVYLFTFTNKNGSSVSITNYGATVTAWRSKDRYGKLCDNIIGFDDAALYFGDHPHFGSTVGRYANRIAYGKFELEGRSYQLPVNNGAHHLHGGYKGFDKVVWNATVDEHGKLHLDHLSPDEEQGYPGNLQVGISFDFTDDEELIIQYRAKTDAPTILNLTNHCYFDLGGNNEPILDDLLYINANQYTPVDAGLIPTGELLPVAGTALDFRTARKIGEPIPAGGYDHNYVLNREGTGLQHAATLQHRSNGKKLEVFTTEPGLQLYTANGLDGSYHNRNGNAIGAYTAVCLETQHFPDTPNHHHFPSTILFPGKLFRSETVYRIKTGV